MRILPSILAFALALAGSGDAWSQPPCPHGSCTNPWVFLRDSNNAVRGSLLIVGSGSDATVQFRDAKGVVLEAPFGKALAGTPKGQAPPLALEPDPPPAGKVDAKKDIELLQSQIATLQRNVKSLQARLNDN